MKEITGTDGRQYKLSESGTAYHIETPDEVCDILERCRSNGQRVRVYYGDRRTGRDWGEMHDVSGTIGRSTGERKIPLLIARSTSRGGGALLSHCIVKIRTSPEGRVLYQAENYQAPKVEVITAKAAGYTHAVIFNGETVSNHRDVRSAKRMQSKLI